MKKIIISRNLKAALDKMKDIMSRDDIKVFAAPSGDDILEINRKENADLIVMNLDMPGMAGDKVCSAIKEDKMLRSAFIIIVCNDSKTEISRCYACKANAFVSKKTAPEELAAKIRRFLANISERDNLRTIIEVIVRGRHRDRNFFAISENISISGMLIGTYEVLEKDDELKCSFFYGRNAISLNCKVVRTLRLENTDQNHYGLKFMNLTPFTKLKIGDFIKGVKRTG